MLAYISRSSSRSSLAVRKTTVGLTPKEFSEKVSAGLEGHLTEPTTSISSFHSAQGRYMVWRYGDMGSRSHLIQASSQARASPICNFLSSDQAGIPVADETGEIR